MAGTSLFQGSITNAQRLGLDGKAQQKARPRGCLCLYADELAMKWCLQALLSLRSVPPAKLSFPVQPRGCSGHTLHFWASTLLLHRSTLHPPDSTLVMVGHL